MWLCKLDGEKVSIAVIFDDYIPKPFLEHLLEPFGWHDVLAMVDVRANVHATRHCDDD